MKKEKNKLGAFGFYITTLFLGMATCIATFFIVFSLFSTDSKLLPEEEKTQVVSSSSTSPEKVTTPSPTAEPVPISYNAIVTDVDAAKRQLTVFNLDTQTDTAISIQQDTSIKNKSDEDINIDSLKLGDVVIVSNDTIQINKTSFEFKRLTDLNLNHKANTITVNNRAYKYSDNTIVTYESKPFSISKVKPFSMINISGADDKIFYIEVLKSYSQLQFKSADKIIGGTIKVDSKQPILLSEGNGTELSEGPHIIFVSGDNIETYSKNIFVKANETVTVDLSNVQFKHGVVNLQIDIDNCVVYIDKEKVSVSEPILLAYGKHNLKVTKAGYDTYEQSINVNSDYVDVSVHMGKKIEVGEVTIKTDPVDAEVYIDDVKTAQTSSVIYGKHRVTVKKEGYIDASLPIDVNNPQLTFSVTLQQITN